MKNVFKKAAAAVMAFTLLGAGTTFAKPISANTNKITASAATVNPDSPHNHGQYTKYDDVKVTAWVESDDGYPTTIFTLHVNVYDVWICRACGRESNRKLIASATERVSSTDAGAFERAYSNAMNKARRRY